MRLFQRLLRRREDGAVAVEAAIMVPVLCTLVFGMIEFAFVMKDYAGVSSMARTGARIASTGADAGPGVCDTSVGAPPCTPASAPALAQLAADAMQRSGALTEPDNINFILIYKANAKGYPGNRNSMPADCSGSADCVMFRWRPALNQFRYVSGTWVSSSISACFPGTGANPLDRVGIYIDTTHPMLTGLFGASFSLRDHAVMDFEPLPTQSCNGRGVTNGGHA